MTDIVKAVRAIYDYCEVHQKCENCIFRDGGGCALSDEPYLWDPGLIGGVTDDHSVSGLIDE